MAETIYRGPAISLGSLIGNVTTQAGQQVGAVEPTDGPGIEYQANGFPDVRFGPFNKDSLKPGRLPGFLNSPYVVMADGIAQATGSAVLAALANAVSGTPMALTTVDLGGGGAGVCSLAHAIPITPLAGGLGNSFPPGNIVTAAIAIDFGFTTGTTNATSTVTVPDSTQFYVGQWIVIAGAGNSAKTLPLICQVLTLPSATTITVSPTPASSLTNSAIGSGNYYMNTTGTFPFGISATAYQPYVWAGVAAFLNPLEAITRNVTITGVSGGTGGTFLVKGWDIYGMAMSELITVAAGVATGVGNKAFKYVASITPQFSDAHTYSAGIGNKSGLAIRSDRWEYTNLFFNGTFGTTSNGFVAAVTTTPTTTTGDVRGTIDVSAGSGFNSAFDGTKRLTWMMSVPLFNIINATPNNAVPMFGQTQV